MKKVLIIQGHPDANSFNYAISDAYQQGVESAGGEVQVIKVGEITFNPNLQYGYRQRTELEPDLEKAREQILWAEHIVVVHPLWWGGVPALLKGFIDRVFLPGFAFEYRENSVWWDKLLKGRTGRIICTMDQPYFYYNWVNGKPAINQLKKMTMEFCGIAPTGVTTFGPIRSSELEQRKKWLNQVKKLGENMN